MQCMSTQSLSPNKLLRKLEARLRGKVGRAIYDYNMIEDGDRIIDPRSKTHVLQPWDVAYALLSAVNLSLAPQYIS